MPYIKDSLKKFNNLPLEIILTVDSDEVGDKMEILNKKYNVNLGALIIFIVTGDLPLSKAQKYLEEEFSLSPAVAKKLVVDLQKNIFIPLKKRLDFLNANPKKEMTIREEKEILLDIFSNNLIKEIKQHIIIINAVNARIFYVLANDLKFKTKLENALLANEEVLTSQVFKMKGKTRKPTIANWIKDFTMEKGTDMFDDLVLSDYIITSPNAKILNDEEKLLLKKLLILYRNLKFFPESMPSDDIKDWEIIPGDSQSEVLNKARSVSGPPKTEQEKEIEKLIEKEKSDNLSGLEKMVLEEEIKRRKKIEELEILAKKYKNGSLEQQAVLQELERLKKEMSSNIKKL